MTLNRQKSLKVASASIALQLVTPMNTVFSWVIHSENSKIKLGKNVLKSVIKIQLVTPFRIRLRLKDATLNEAAMV